MIRYIVIGVTNKFVKFSMPEAVATAEWQENQHVCILRVQSHYNKPVRVDLVTTVIPIKTVAANVEIESIENNLNFEKP